MPLSAKILAFLNVLAAGLFLYLAATLVYAPRQVWSRAVFQRELVLEGLPVDEFDPGWRPDRPLAADLGEEDSAVLTDFFKLVGPAGKPVVRSQDREVERVRVETMKDIDGQADDAAKRKRIKELLFAQARSFDEREEMANKFADKDVSVDDLKKLLDDKFEDAVRDVSLGGRVASDRHILAKRRLVAHLLYNLSAEPDWHKRVMIIVGLRNYIYEADLQALALRDMIARTKSAALSERIAFEAEYLRQRDRILALSQAVERQQVALASLKELRDRQQKEIIDPLTARKKELEDELVKAKADTTDVLARQDALETTLFDLHREIGKLLTENQKLEREIRLMELGPVRGVQR
jgi:hypothetical protein